MDAKNTRESDDAILDAALELSRIEGWGAVSLERTANLANTELEQVQQLYPDIRRLGAGVMRRMLERLPEELEDEIDKDTSLRDRLYACVAHMLRTLEPHKDFVAWIRRESINPFSASAALQLPLVYRYLRVVREQLELAKARGEINERVIVPISVAAFWAIHLRLIGLWLDDRSPGSEQTHATAARWLANFVRTLHGA